MIQFAVILPAAGKSVRFGGSRGKLLEPLGGEPVVRHSVRAFLGRQDVAAVVLATGGDEVPLLTEALGPAADDSRIRFCRGGESRAHSVHNALLCVPNGINWIAVHDAARPLVSQAVIDRALAAAR